MVVLNMNNPYLLACALNLIVFGAVWIYVQHRFRLPFLVFVVVAATCMPLPVALLPGRLVFVGDVIGTVLLIACLLGQGPAAKKSSGFLYWVMGIYAVGLIAWPL